MTKKIAIRKASVSDVDEIVKIHIDAFKGFFLTSLGESFLKFYYNCFIKSHDTIILVAISDNKDLLGFSAATKFCKGFNSRLIKSNLFAFSILSLKMLFTDPKSLFRLVKNLTKKGNSIEDDEDYAELYSIGVNKIAQGLGIGKKLMGEMEKEMAREGVERISLTTDFYNNEQAVGFYHAMGYETLYEFVAYPNRKMYRLIKNINCIVNI